MLIQADSIDYDENTGQIKASGNIYFHDFDRNEQLWAERVEYDTASEAGKFYDVRGETTPHIDARPGVLTSSSPFYFQGKWAERLKGKYILYEGFITNCKMPNPWWRLRGPKFEIEPGERAIAHRSLFLVRKMPLFYAPFFYKSLRKMPRKSGFLMPSAGNSSRRGLMFGFGYYWAINRSYDATYRFQDFTERGFAHHLDLRGKPREGTDFDAIFYGVQDRGLKLSGNQPPIKQGGLSVYVVAKSELGKGWSGRASINYLSSFTFRAGVHGIVQRGDRFGGPIGRFREQELVRLYLQRGLHAPGELPAGRVRRHRPRDRSRRQGERFGDDPKAAGGRFRRPRPQDQEGPAILVLHALHRRLAVSFAARLFIRHRAHRPLPVKRVHAPAGRGAHRHHGVALEGLSPDPELRSTGNLLRPEPDAPPTTGTTCPERTSCAIPTSLRWTW